MWDFSRTGWYIPPSVSDTEGTMKLPSSSPMDQEPQATPFMLGVSPRRLTPEAILDQWKAWREAPSMPHRIRTEYENNVRVRWNLHTNALEGNALTHSDTALLLLVGKTNANLLFRDCEEMVGHDAAITGMKRWAQTNRNLTPRELLIWHRLLLVRDRVINLPSSHERLQLTHTIYAGRYKQAANVIQRRDGSIKRFAPPDEVNTRITRLLHQLEDALPSLTARPPAVDLPSLLAWQHAEFINIHPFDDGNGRMGRLLNSWLCLKAGFPVSIIPVAARNIYLEAMDRSDRDTQPLRDLLAATLVKEMDFGLAVARGESDPTPSNEEADPKRPPQPPPTIVVNGWD